MSQMIERVAKAMADKVALNYDHNKAIFDLYARTAILAMREPTEEMIDAGNCNDLYNDTLLYSWQTMIDEALK